MRAFQTLQMTAQDTSTICRHVEQTLGIDKKRLQVEPVQRMRKVSFVGLLPLPDAVTLPLQGRKVPLPNRVHFVNVYRQAAYSLFVVRKLT